MSERQCCATCARLVDKRDGSWWCNAVERRIYDWEIDDYPPCGCAKWMPKDERAKKEDGE